MQRRRPWGLLVLALVVAATAWWTCSGEEDTRSPPPQTPVPVEVAAPPEPLPERLFVLPPDAGAAVDAGRSVIDAGQSHELSAPEVEAYMKKWRDALETVARQQRPAPITAIRTEAEQKPEPACEPGLKKLGLMSPPAIDHVVVVDTSGSMSNSLKAVGEWLGQLEYLLARSGREYRLLVLAEPRRLVLGDAGVIQRVVGSHDALEVMLKSASEEPPRWLSMLRESSELRLVLVTDDRPDTDQVKVWLERLAAVFGRSRPLSLSVIGGFAVADPARPVLFKADPVSTVRCRPERVRRGAEAFGIDPGEVYQQLAIETGGVRASLCSELSRLALIEPLLADARPQGGCAWSLGPKARVVDARARGKRGSDYLLREYTASSCAGMKRSYLVDGPMLALCPDTCARLRDEGWEEVEVRISCER